MNLAQWCPSCPKEGLFWRENSGDCPAVAVEEGNVSHQPWWSRKSHKWGRKEKGGSTHMTEIHKIQSQTARVSQYLHVCVVTCFNSSLTQLSHLFCSGPVSQQFKWPDCPVHGDQTLCSGWWGWGLHARREDHLEEVHDADETPACGCSGNTLTLCNKVNNHLQIKRIKQKSGWTERRD